MTDNNHGSFNAFSVDVEGLFCTALHVELINSINVCIREDDDEQNITELHRISVESFLEIPFHLKYTFCI